MTLVPLLLLAVALDARPFESPQRGEGAGTHATTRPSFDRIGESAVLEVLSGGPNSLVKKTNAKRDSRSPGQLTNKRTGVTCTMLIVQGPEVDPGIHALSSGPVLDRIVNNVASPCVE